MGNDMWDIFGEIWRYIGEILGWLLNQIVKKWRCLQYDHLNGKMIKMLKRDIP